MTYYATTYRYIDDAERVGEARPEHRDYLAGLTEHGQLAVSGPYAGSGPAGALLVFVADSEDRARELIDSDPFVRDGLVAELTIQEWKPVSGSLLDQF